MLADLRFRDHQSLFASQAPVAHDETELWLGRFDRP
jgi:hypothetical protein